MNICFFNFHFNFILNGNNYHELFTYLYFILNLSINSKLIWNRKEMVENFHSIKESVQKFARNTLSFELVPREQLSILMEVIKLSYCSMKIAAPRTYMIYICVRSSPVSSSPCIKSTMRM